MRIRRHRSAVSLILRLTVCALRTLSRRFRCPHRRRRSVAGNVRLALTILMSSLSALAVVCRRLLPVDLCATLQLARNFWCRDRMVLCDLPNRRPTSRYDIPASNSPIHRHRSASVICRGIAKTEIRKQVQICWTAFLFALGMIRGSDNSSKSRAVVARSPRLEALVKKSSGQF